MDVYVVNRNKQENGNHEIHNLSKGCSYMPSSVNTLYLGPHKDCRGAVIKAREILGEECLVNGCYYCSHGCHREHE